MAITYHLQVKVFFVNSSGLLLIALWIFLQMVAAYFIMYVSPETRKHITIFRNLPDLEINNFG
jgi:hypothetical protein